MNDHEITTLIRSLCRPHPSGGVVIERAAILAAGASSPEVIEWILGHSGTPEIPAAANRGLHGSSLSAGSSRVSPHPTRFILPADTLH